MSIAIISDVHIKPNRNNEQEILLKFLSNEKVVNASKIVLLGDIFDFFCGPHKQFINIYPAIFKRIQFLLENGSVIYYFEGNHDVHIESFFRKYFSKFYQEKKLIIEQYSLDFNINGKKYYFSHGDELEPNSEAYQKYKAFILSKPIKILAEKIMPYFILSKLAQKASDASRNRGRLVFNEAKVRDSYRQGAEVKLKQGYDVVVSGHCHVKDFYESDFGVYVNNGYAPEENTFIYISESNTITFEKLD